MCPCSANEKPNPCNVGVHARINIESKACGSTHPLVIIVSNVHNDGPRIRQYSATKSVPRYEHVLACTPWKPIAIFGHEIHTLHNQTNTGRLYLYDDQPGKTGNMCGQRSTIFPTAISTIIQPGCGSEREFSASNCQRRALLALILKY